MHDLLLGLGTQGNRRAIQPSKRSEDNYGLNVFFRRIPEEKKLICGAFELFRGPDTRAPPAVFVLLITVRPSRVATIYAGKNAALPISLVDIICENYYDFVETLLESLRSRPRK